ncbi:DUF4422 domain-containing protein [Liquorilactobacillus sicerae]|uniref:DUF4422 domain-containing protein n=1 Tax=Liquorilactobacillus sicerae TaxID=1416943 RepID=UPI002481038D|nr:DUF4422 domain-containing protein [Liquorilactobacillus sicerae]
MKVEVYVVSHKKYKIPKKDGIYIPIQVGNGEGIPNFLRDNSGENTSFKNNSYCELTAQYWAWKNRDANVKGLVHYRRLLVEKNVFLNKFNYNLVLGKNDIVNILKKYDVIVPQKRNYFVENLRNHYNHSHKKIGLITTELVLKEDYPEYFRIFEEHLKSTKSHMFNMIIAKADIFDEYSNWLFEVLRKVENKIDISNFSESEQRIFGYLSELLLDVWIKKNGLTFYEFPVGFVEGESKLIKGFKMLKRKYLKSE